MLYSYLLLFLISNGKADLSFLFKGKTPTDGEISEKQKKEADLEWLRNKNPQSYYMTNSGGLKLHVLYLPATETTDRYILCIHGFHSRGEWEFASVSRFYHEHGFNVLMTDQRACGKSEGKYMTYGAKESLDVGMDRLYDR
jgi:pimeloyl-ACP methyl ester carboxylesterase